VDLFKHNGMSLFWAEDYIFSVPEVPQIISWQFAQMRCGVKYHKQPIHFYVMPHAPGQTAADFQGAIGVTGTLAANRLAQAADLVLGIGTRYTDFTTASKTAFRNPDVRFVNINVAEFDAFKHSALPVIGDARATLAELGSALTGYAAEAAYSGEARALHDEWETEVDRIYAIRNEPLPSQGELIGAVNELGEADGIMVCAAGSLPGDLHKLWRARHAKNYHLEYGYSCMGYEIAGGLGAKMAAPDREVYVMVGDGSYLMLANEIVTSIQEGYKLTIVLMDNHGYKSIGGLSRSLGQEGFGSRYAYRKDGALPGDETETVETLPVDLAGNARSLGAHVFECTSYDEFVEALDDAKTQTLRLGTYRDLSNLFLLYSAISLYTL